MNGLSALSGLPGINLGNSDLPNGMKPYSKLNGQVERVYTKRNEFKNV